LKSGISASAKQRGFTLFYAVLVSSLLLAIGVAIFNITFKELILSSGARESVNAFYAADTGLECALYWDLRHTALSAPAFGFYGDSLASGLSAYWRFEDGDGSLVAVDSSGTGHVGTLTNMDASIAWVDGQIGDALSFDGIDDYVNVAQNVGGFDKSDRFSVSAWVNAPVGTTDRMIFGNAWGKPGFELRLTTENKARFILITDGSNYLGVDSEALGAGWHHVVGVWDGDTPHVYVDGAEQSVTDVQAGFVTSITTSAPTFIGKSPEPATPIYFKGAIDDLRVYNRRLTENEIDKLHDERSNLQFVQPVEQGSNALCLGADITDPTTGWDPDAGWDISTTTSSASTTFDMILPNDRCATVQVLKNAATTTIISRGYSSCEINNRRRVERAIRAIY
jgi:Tfp pilus assembly protein PilX